MGLVVGLLENAMEKIAGTGDLMLQEDFMMNIFCQLQDQIDPFYEYLTFVFEDKMSKPVSVLVALGDKVIPFDLLRAELFYQTKNHNSQTATFCHRLVEEIATTMLIELRGPRKPMQHTYQVHSQVRISEDNRKASMGMMDNNIPKSNHATSATSLVTGGMISLYHAAAEGQTRVNNDMGRAHDTLIGRSKESNVKSIGTFHTLHS